MQYEVKILLDRILSLVSTAFVFWYQELSNGLLAYPFNFFGDIPYTNVTLDYEMNFYSLVPGQTFVKIQDVMDIQGGLLCYDYA